MRKLKLNETTKKELALSYGDILMRIGENSLSDLELDNLLKVLLNMFKDIDNTDMSALEKNLTSTMATKAKEKKGKKIFELLKTLEKGKEFKISEEDKAIEERLNRHFKEDFIKEAKTKKVDSNFEVQTKYPKANKKLYYEQHKVLLTILTSNIATQNEVDNIKVLIEKDFSFTSSIKRVIKDKSNYPRIKRLCELQDQRFKESEEASKRLY